jgi:glucose-6-phosphate 1-dehydrogenase
MAKLARLLLLGATGDLTNRYLLPALAELVASGNVPDDLEVLGVARDELDTESFKARAREQLEEHGSNVPVEARDELVARLRYQRGDVTDSRTIDEAVEALDGPLIAYLALPPFLFEEVIDALARSGLDDRSRLVVEKPFGTDLTSARRLNERLHACFPEEAVFRVDHFLGMQTVRNLLGLRFGNRVFEPLWCAEHIEAIDITWDETVALEGRAGYYDTTGALRDMIQNHLLQLLALTAMECPSALDEQGLRDAKVEALRSVRRPDHDEVGASTTRARYTAGEVGDRSLPAYADEDGVDGERRTETFAFLELFVDNDRWRGVPFRLRTGKALDADRRLIRIRFREAPPLPFSHDETPPANDLSMTMDPDRISFRLNLNASGDPFGLEPASLDLELAAPDLSAYARVLLDAFDGSPALSIRDDEAEESWRIIEPILDAWTRGATPLVEYRAGSSGPADV